MIAVNVDRLVVVVEEEVLLVVMSSVARVSSIREGEEVGVCVGHPEVEVFIHHRKVVMQLLLIV
mgnify:FL=1